MRNIPSKMFMENSTVLKNTLQPYIELNNRNCERFAVGLDVYALMSWNELKDHDFLGHLIDINKEGCGIYYITDRINACTLLSRKTCKLKFVCASKTFELQKNTVVYDNELIRYSSERISARRCGIMFDEFVKVSHLR